MSKHNLSHATEIDYGPAYHPGANGGRRGVPLVPGLVQVSLGAPLAADADGIAASQDTSAAGPLALTATPVSLGVARNVTITSAGDDSGATFTVVGADQYGAAMREDIAGANIATAAGAKAFGRIDSVSASAGTAGNVTVGWGDVLGLPYRIGGAYDVLAAYADGTEELASSTLVAGDGADATATTGDVRGTIDPATAADGGTVYRLWLKVHDAGSREGAYGVAQA